jgi:inner membrane protein
MNDSWLKRSVMLRMTIIGGLTFAMLVPSVLIMGLISEREQTRNAAITEVSEKWGARQTITGPILTLPFKRVIRSEKGDTRTVVEHAQLLPATLAISASVSPEVRYRGIYQVTLYNAIADLRGIFSLDGLGALNIKTEDVVWEEASLTFGISDLKGVKESLHVRWGSREFPAEPGVATGNALRSGISVKPNVSPGQPHYEFAVRVNLNGSEQLEFVPVGKQTNVEVSSVWKSPSFVGRFLPDERTVREAGFDAKWNVLHLNRNFPQQWISERLSGDNEKIQFEQFAFGVKLISPVDQYQQTLRSAKYAIMFIALTFLAFFLTEVLTRKVGHPVQYALIGFALVLFYCLLLSLSEHMSFVAAYVISSAAIVALIGGYTRSVLGTNRFAATISLLLALLYTFLFVILQEEDYALLFGSIGLFAVLGLVMYLTRRIDWYTVGKSEGTA